MGKGSTPTTTTTSGPPQAVLDQYNKVTGIANQVAQTPLNQYQGNMVQGFTPMQQQAFQGIQDAQGVANPYINAAAQYAGQSATPIGVPGGMSGGQLSGLAQSGLGYSNQSAGTNIGAAGQPGINGITSALGMGAPQNYAGNVGQYMSPYTQQVVNATQAQFNNQNAQANQQSIGNSISKGAWGGDRAGIAQAELANQQQLAQAPVIAGLYNSGYANAQNQLTQQQQLGIQGSTTQATLGQQAAQQQGALQQAAAAQQLGLYGNQQQLGIGAQEATNSGAAQAGFALGSLGQQAQSSALTNAAALYQAGTQQQQLGQEQLNIPYEQFMAQQAYPFQASQYLSNISQGIGGGSGGQSSTTSPGPSTGSQVLGGLTSGAGLLSATGAFGNNGWLTGSSLPDVSGYSQPLLNGISGGDILGSNLGSLSSVPWARGGAIHRASGGQVPRGFATGGAPWLNPNVEDASVSFIPQAAPGATGIANSWLKTPQTTQTGSSGGGDDTLQTIGQIASIAATVAALNKGGRVSGYAQGGIVPTLPEPRGDIHAQIAAMLSGRGTKDAVFLAPGNERDAPANLPPNVHQVRRAEGVLLTTNAEKAKAFASARTLTDAAMAHLLGYPQSKDAAIESGAPIVMEARDHSGNVAASALASADRAHQTARALARQVPGSEIKSSSPEAAVARRLPAGFAGGGGVVPRGFDAGGAADENNPMPYVTEAQAGGGGPGANAMAGLLNSQLQSLSRVPASQFHMMDNGGSQGAAPQAPAGFGAGGSYLPAPGRPGIMIPQLATPTASKADIPANLLTDYAPPPVSSSPYTSTTFPSLSGKAGDPVTTSVVPVQGADGNWQTPAQAAASAAATAAAPRASQTQKILAGDPTAVSQYVNDPNNADVGSVYNSFNAQQKQQFPTLDSFAQYQFQHTGQNENRSLGLDSASPSAQPPAGGYTLPDGSTIDINSLVGGLGAGGANSYGFRSGGMVRPRGFAIGGETGRRGYNDPDFTPDAPVKFDFANGDYGFLPPGPGDDLNPAPKGLTSGQHLFNDWTLPTLGSPNYVPDAVAKDAAPPYVVKPREAANVNAAPLQPQAAVAERDATPVFPAPLSGDNDYANIVPDGPVTSPDPTIYDLANQNTLSPVMGNTRVPPGGALPVRNQGAPRPSLTARSMPAGFTPSPSAVPPPPVAPPVAPAVAAVSAPPSHEAPDSDGSFLNSPWMALVAAGAGMMASRSPDLGGGIGEGLQAGLKYANIQQVEKDRREAQAAENDYRNRDVDLRAKQISQGISQHLDTMNIETKKLALEQQKAADDANYHRSEIGVRGSEAASRALEAGRGYYEPQGPALNADGTPVLVNGQPGWTYMDKYTGNTHVSSAPAPGTMGMKMPGQTTTILDRLMVPVEQGGPGLSFEEALAFSKDPNGYGAERLTLQQRESARKAANNNYGNPNFNADRDLQEDHYVPPQHGGRPATAPGAPAPAAPIGSRANPLVPRTQADIDNAPAGTVIQTPNGLMVK